MSSFKKIAIVTPVFPPYCGGIGNVALNHARLLLARDCNVTVFTPNYGQPKNSTEYGFKVELLSPIIKYGNAAYVPSLCRKLKDFDCVILEYPFFGGMRAVYSAKKKYNFKLILNYNMDVVGSGLKGLVFLYATKVFLPRVVKISDVVIASSSDYAKNSDLGNYWKDDDPKFKVLPNGVDISKFHPDDSNSEFKKNLNISPDKKIILFVGGLDKAHYFKGVEYLIRSVKFLRLKDDFKIVIAGRGELQSEYRALSEQFGVRDKILFTGGVSDSALVKLYQIADVTILPSIDRSESFGIVLLESMACGTPVVASNLPGVRSVFEEGKSGFVAKIKDEKDIAEKIQNILNNPEKSAQMRGECRELVEKKYNWENIGNELAEIVVN